MATPVRRGLLLLLLAVVSLFIAADSTNILYSGETLNEGERLSSKPSYAFCMQKYCELRLYDKGKIVWSTKGGSTGCRLTLQNDGNLVMYSKTNKTIWTSGSKGPKGRYVLILQENRNVVVYGPRLWATGTNTTSSLLGVDDNGAALPPSHAPNFLRAGEKLKVNDSLTWANYKLIMQEDCDLVLYDGKELVWHTDTAGAAKKCLVTMQSVGDLVMYNVVTGAVIWTSSKKGVHGHYALVLQKDRDVVVYGPDRWTSGTYIRAGIDDDAPLAPTEIKDNGEPKFIRSTGNREMANL